MSTGQAPITDPALFLLAWKGGQTPMDKILFAILGLAVAVVEELFDDE